MFRHPAPTPPPTPATKTPLPPVSVTADGPAMRPSLAGCQPRRETHWIPTWQREERVGRSSPIREGFCQSGGMGILRANSGGADGGKNCVFVVVF